jgi:hypothetical protein
VQDDFFAGFAGNAEARRGNQTAARMYLTRTARELPGTVYATKAQDWLDRRATPEAPKGYTCLSCHEEPT